MRNSKYKHMKKIKMNDDFVHKKTWYHEKEFMMKDKHISFDDK
jgi:hypothetical protein